MAGWKNLDYCPNMYSCEIFELSDMAQHLGCKLSIKSLIDSLSDKQQFLFIALLNCSTLQLLKTKTMVSTQKICIYISLIN